jgi:hypothetical protein
MVIHEQTVVEKCGLSVVSPAPNYKLFEVLTSRFQENMITRKQKLGGPMFSGMKPGKQDIKKKSRNQDCKKS